MATSSTPWPKPSSKNNVFMNIMRLSKKVNDLHLNVRLAEKAIKRELARQNNQKGTTLALAHGKITELRKRRKNVTARPRWRGMLGPVKINNSTNKQLKQINQNINRIHAMVKNKEQHFGARVAAVERLADDPNPTSDTIYALRKLRDDAERHGYTAVVAMATKALKDVEMKLFIKSLPSPPRHPV